MKRLALFAFLLTVCASLHAQADSSLCAQLRQADFSKQIIKETPPAGANWAERQCYYIRRQLTGRDFYEPANYMFFRPAVKTIGFVPAVFALSDRLLRDSKIGTYDVHIDPDINKIQEGPEAYAPWRKER